MVRVRWQYFPWTEVPYRSFESEFQRGPCGLRANANHSSSSSYMRIFFKFSTIKENTNSPLRYIIETKDANLVKEWTMMTCVCFAFWSKGNWMRLGGLNVVLNYTNFWQCPTSSPQIIISFGDSDENYCLIARWLWLLDTFQKLKCVLNMEKVE